MACIPDLIRTAERENHLKGNMGARGGFGVRPAVLVKVAVPRPRRLDVQESDEFNRYVGVLRRCIEASHGL